jgi:DHA2 family multidrug resistance protein-like MFS transporter
MLGPEAGDPPPSTKATRREWIGLLVLALPCLVYAMDLTILHLAVPAIAEELKPSSSALLWIVDIYGFMVAGALVTMGSLGDRIGRRRMLMIGALAFAVTSVLAAISTSSETLIAARAVQGLAGATLAPSTLSLIRHMFHDDRERATAIGFWVASFSVGAALGPLFGGLILSSFHWGAVFLVNVPVMALLIAVGPILLPEFRDPDAERIDVVSVLQSLAAVLLIVYAVKRVAEAGVTAPAVVAIVLGLGAGWVFIMRQRRLADPLIDMKLLTAPMLAAALAFNLLDVFVVAGAFLLIAQYFQLVLGMAPLEAGLWTAPAGITFALGSVASSWLNRYFSARLIIASGFMIAAVGFLFLTQLSGATSPLLLTVGMVIFSAGLAPVGPITTDVVLSEAPPERAGAASAVSEMSFELGGAFGIAILGSIVTAIYRDGLGDAGLLRDYSEAVIEASKETLGGALAAAQELAPAASQRLVEAARASFIAGFEAASFAAAALCLASAGLAATVLRR